MEICKTFYGKAFETIVKVCDESVTMKKEFKEAQANHIARGKGRGKRFKPINVRAYTRAGIRLSSWFWFVRTCEFLRKYNFKPSTLGLRTIWLKDELGSVKIEGVIMKPENCRTPCEFRWVECYSETVRVLSEDIVGPENCLREKEPLETYLRLNQATEKTLCPDR